MRRNISEILTLAAAALLAAGCAGRIDPQGECDGTVGFAVDVAGSIEEVKAGTKADGDQTIASFKVAAYNNDGSDHDPFIAPGTNVTVSDSKGSTDIRWTKPYAKVFYAYANLPASGASVTPAYDGQTLEFTALPAVAENQTDVLLAAESTNGGDTRTAALTFKHALASVTFNAGQMQNVASVNSITVKGVYSKGSVTQSSDGNISAWSGTTTTDIPQTGLSVTPPVSGSTQIGSTLLLIPQTGSIAIELGVTMQDTSTKTLAGTVSIDGNAWKAGYATTYTIGYTESKDLHFTATVTEWSDPASSTAMNMEKYLDRDIQNIWDLFKFKEDVEKGVNMAGATISFANYSHEFDNVPEVPFTAIFDQYGVLDGATIEGFGEAFEIFQGELNNPNDPDNYGFFSTLSSNNVTINNLTLKFNYTESIISATGSVGGFVGNCTGSCLTLNNCSIQNFGPSLSSNCILGGVVGRTSGEIHIRNSHLGQSDFSQRCRYGSFVLGYASGNNVVEISNCEIEACMASTSESGTLFGAYLGCGKGNLNIIISDGVCEDSMFLNTPGTPGYYYTGDGTLNNYYVDSYHFHAIGGDLPISGATFTLTGMTEYQCSNY